MPLEHANHVHNSLIRLENLADQLKEEGYTPQNVDEVHDNLSEFLHALASASPLRLYKDALRKAADAVTN